MPSLHQIRNEFSKSSLHRSSMETSPFAQFKKWMDEALGADIPEPTAMTLSTCNAQGRPSSRTVLLKDADDKGFTFFTNYHSRKGAELDANPFASLLFFWPLLERQIRIEGKVEKTSQVISDQYFNSRPIESRIAAIVSPQSKVVASRDELDTLYNMYKRNHSTDAIERPAHWGGYRLIPDCFEFWQGRPNRLHDRIVYKWTGTDWVMERLGA